LLVYHHQQVSNANLSPRSRSVYAEALPRRGVVPARPSSSPATPNPDGKVPGSSSIVTMGVGRGRDSVYRGYRVPAPPSQVAARTAQVDAQPTKLRGKRSVPSSTLCGRDRLKVRPLLSLKASATSRLVAQAVRRTAPSFGSTEQSMFHEINQDRIDRVRHGHHRGDHRDH